MASPTIGKTLSTQGDIQALQIAAATVFQPRMPITTKALFAGRWDQITTLTDAVSQPGLHVVIYGERGVGKTSLANIVRPIVQVLVDGFRFEVGHEIEPSRERIVIKINSTSTDTFSTVWERLFSELTWLDNKPALGLIPTQGGRVSALDTFKLDPPLTVDNVRNVLKHVPGAIFIIDEFDRAAGNIGAEVTDLIKTLSDFGADCTLILVGVSDTVDQLALDHASINRAVVQILLPRMETSELREILTKGEAALTVTFSAEAANLIVNISQGLPHYTHLLGLHSVRLAAARSVRQIEQQDVFGALKAAVKQSEQTVTEKYLKATHSAHKDALFRHVLLACALTAAKSRDPLGYFNPAAIIDPLSMILRRPVEIATFNKHLNDFAQDKRGGILEKTGEPWAYRFRFRDALLVPFVYMEAVSSGLINKDQLTEVLGTAI